MGYTNLIGSDNSPKAIADTEKNLDWIIKNYQLPITNYRLLITDATKLSNHLKPESITCIVTEPYLGRPLHGNESEIFIKKQITELKTLYLNAFKEFYKILKPGGIVVFVIPRFKFKSEWIKIEIEKEIEKIGFELSPFTVQTHCYASLQYHRPNQHLAREIWRFKKIP
jgi:tRNA G10  N-methylase Trm11